MSDEWGQDDEIVKPASDWGADDEIVKPVAASRPSTATHRGDVTRKVTSDARPDQAYGRGAIPTGPGGLDERGPGPTGRIDPDLYEMGAIARRPKGMNTAVKAEKGKAVGVKPGKNDPLDGEGAEALFKRRGQQFVGGFVDTGASAFEATDVAGAAIDQRQKTAASGVAADKRAEIARLQQSLKVNQFLDETGRASIQARIDALEEGVAKEMKIGATDIVPASEREGFKTADAVRKGTAEYIGVPDPRDQGFWGRFATTAGGAAGMATATAVGGAVGGLPGATIAGASAGAALTAPQMYKEAIAAGASEEEALKAGEWGLIIGSGEVLPILSALKFLPPAIRVKAVNAYLRRVGDVTLNGGEEAAQETISQIAQNLVAQNIYDPERGTMQGTGEAAVMGAILGTGLSAGANAVEAVSEAKTPKAPKIQTGDTALDVTAALTTSVPPDRSAV